MRSQEVTFYSEGARISALWRTPDTPERQLRAVVQGPGWLGLKDARLYMRYHDALTAAGFAVLIIDYRGFGDSEGDPRLLSLQGQLRDLINAVTYLTTRDDVDGDAIGVFGTGGTGGGNAVLLASADSRIRAAVSQVPIADGADWLRRMRSEQEWFAFLQSLDEDRRQRALTGAGRLVNPREEIMVPTTERRTLAVKADVDERIPTAVSLAAADEVLAYRPIDASAQLTVPLLVIAVENDAVTPTDHAVRLYEAARGPRALIMQRHTTHYAAYDRYWTAVTPRIVDWFRRYLRGGEAMVRMTTNTTESIEWLEGTSGD